MFGFWAHALEFIEVRSQTKMDLVPVSPHHCLIFIQNNPDKDSEKFVKNYFYSSGAMTRTNKILGTDYDLKEVSNAYF
jgi:hypothetical protein